LRPSFVPTKAGAIGIQEDAPQQISQSGQSDLFSAIEPQSIKLSVSASVNSMRSPDGSASLLCALPEETLKKTVSDHAVNLVQSKSDDSSPPVAKGGHHWFSSLLSAVSIPFLTQNTHPMLGQLWGQGGLQQLLAQNQGLSRVTVLETKTPDHEYHIDLGFADCYFSHQHQEKLDGSQSYDRSITLEAKPLPLSLLSEFGIVDTELRASPSVTLACGSEKQSDSEGHSNLSFGVYVNCAFGFQDSQLDAMLTPSFGFETSKDAVQVAAQISARAGGEKYALSYFQPLSDGGQQIEAKADLSFRYTSQASKLSMTVPLTSVPVASAPLRAMTFSDCLGDQSLDQRGPIGLGLN